MNLTPYMNYLRVDTISVIDNAPGYSSFDCSVDSCVRPHQGGVLGWYTSDEFCNTTSSNAIFFIWDPDGSYSGSTTGSGKGIGIWIYYDGKIRTFKTMTTTTYGAFGSCYAPDPGPWGSGDPVWFSW
jgi:hypothetical protein